MKTLDFCETFGGINEAFVKEAHAVTTKAGKPGWLKWGTMAACLCLVLAGIMGMQNGWFGDKNETAGLRSGESITFYKTAIAGASLDLQVETSAMTAEELAEVFGTLPVANANAYFTCDENRFVGIEGKYADMKLVLSVPGVPLMDAVAAGLDAHSIVAGVPVTAGYFVTDANSQGIRTAIYYAYVAFEDCTVYLEHAGTVAEREHVKEAVALAVEQLVEAPVDVSTIRN